MSIGLPVIKQMLKHREPFLFIDSIEDISDNSIEASFHISEENILLKGHFPGDPIVPGVLLIEILAQATVFFVSYNLRKEKGEEFQSTKYNFYLSKINSVKFKSKIVPPAILNVKVKINQALIENFFDVNGQIFVEGELKMTCNMILYYGEKKL